MNPIFRKKDQIKKFLVLLFVLLICAGNVNAALLRWDAVVAPQDIPSVLGYIVYYQDLVTQETFNVNVGNVTEYRLPGNMNLATGTNYRFWVTVYNKDGESDPSNTADWMVPNWLPPVDKLPDIIIQVPDSSSVNITIVNE